MDGGLLWTFLLLLPATFTPAVPGNGGLPNEDSSFPFLRFDVPDMLCWLLFGLLLVFVPALLLLLPLLFEDRFFLEWLFPLLLEFAVIFPLLLNWGENMVDIFGLKTMLLGVGVLLEFAEAEDLSLALTESPVGYFVVRSFIMTLNMSSLDSVSRVTNLFNLKQ